MDQKYRPSHSRPHLLEQGVAGLVVADPRCRSGDLDVDQPASFFTTKIYGQLGIEDGVRRTGLSEQEGGTGAGASPASAEHTLAQALGWLS